MKTIPYIILTYILHTYTYIVRIYFTRIKQYNTLTFIHTYTYYILLFYFMFSKVEYVPIHMYCYIMYLCYVMLDIFTIICEEYTNLLQNSLIYTHLIMGYLLFNTRIFFCSKNMTSFHIFFFDNKNHVVLFHLEV